MPKRARASLDSVTIDSERFKDAKLVRKLHHMVDKLLNSSDGEAHYNATEINSRNLADPFECAWSMLTFSCYTPSNGDLDEWLVQVFGLPKEDRDNAENVVVYPNLGGVETCIEDIFEKGEFSIQSCDHLFAAFVMLDYAFNSAVLKDYLKDMIERLKDVPGLERDMNRARHILSFFENRLQYDVVKTFMQSIKEKDTNTAQYMAYALDWPYEQPGRTGIRRKLAIEKICNKKIARKYSCDNDDDA